MKVEKDAAFLKLFLDQEIYRVVPKQLTENEVPAPSIDIQILGNNSSDVAVIIDGPGETGSVEQIEFLSKILHSINHSLEDVALYKVDQVNINLQDAVKSSVATKVLVFGLKLNLGDSSKTIVTTEKLSLLMKDKTLKRKLWEELKRLL